MAMVERSLSAALFRPNRVFNQQLNLSEWPNYCDHAVTSAGVRLSVGNGLRNPGTSCFKKTESNLGQATRPCRCVGESQVVTPEKPRTYLIKPPQAVCTPSRIHSGLLLTRQQSPAAATRWSHLLQLRVLQLGFAQDRNFWVCIFP